MSQIFDRIKIKPSKLWYLAGALLALNIAVFSMLGRGPGGEYAEVHIFDVGQGDAIYIRTAEGNDILIDGGPGEKVLSKLGDAMPFNDRKIELAILTHPHADHAAGLVEVMRRFEVEKVLVSRIDYDSATYQEFLRLLSEKEIAAVRPQAGQRIFLDRFTVMDILYPIVGEFEPPPKDPNEISTIARVSFGQSQVLLTGDAGTAAENFLVSAGAPLEAEILKVGHQGSKTSSGRNFLEKVEAEFAVISVGKNNYGHPHGEVLGALAGAGSRILRTDRDGDVIFKIYPDRVEVQDQQR